jgi:hypothetical protein
MPPLKTKTHTPFQTIGATYLFTSTVVFWDQVVSAAIIPEEAHRPTFPSLQQHFRKSGYASTSGLSSVNQNLQGLRLNFFPVPSSSYALKDPDFHLRDIIARN